MILSSCLAIKVLKNVYWHWCNNSERKSLFRRIVHLIYRWMQMQLSWRGALEESSFCRLLTKLVKSRFMDLWWQIEISQWKLSFQSSSLNTTFLPYGTPASSSCLKVLVQFLCMRMAEHLWLTNLLRGVNMRGFYLCLGNRGSGLSQFSSQKQHDGNHQVCIVPEDLILFIFFL